MRSPFYFPPLLAFYNACMGGLMRMRKRGAFGTPDRPIDFPQGASVPWWIECRWPTNLVMTFGTDVETYWDPDEAHQIVRPLVTADPCIISASAPARADDIHILIVGAPTLILCNTRRRPNQVPDGDSLHLGWSNA